jgi:hypothetical protein
MLGLVNLLYPHFWSLDELLKTPLGHLGVAGPLVEFRGHAYLPAATPTRMYEFLVIWFG